MKAEWEWAPKKYAAIRKMKDDVQKIAKNAKWSPKKIERIKNHLFFEEHTLTAQDSNINYVGLFASDSEIAAAWDRLYKGDFIKNDIRLLEHEYYESRLERLYRVRNITAHEAVQNHPKGKPWFIPVYEE